MRPLAILSTLLVQVMALCGARAAETLIVPYNQTWDFLNPMGTNPKVADDDFESTWWLPEEEFSTDYNGPVFNIPRAGSPVNVSSINSGSGPGPLGYGDVDNWNGASTALLEPFEGGPPIMSMGKVLTTPNNGNRKASYYRTTFYTNQLLMRPVIRCMIDDGAVIFIDGVQVARVNLTLPSPSALPAYTTLALGDGTTLPVPQSTEDSLLTIDLSTAGNQGTDNGLQASVINPVPSLMAGSHTLAVFVCSFSASSPDQLMALQMTGDDAGISALASNPVRRPSPVSGNPADDTFEFEVTVTQANGGAHGWTSNAAQRPAGGYGQTVHFAGFPVTGPATIVFKDADIASFTCVLKVNVPPPPLTIGQIAFGSQTVPLVCTPDTSPAWVQTGVDVVQQTNGGGLPHLLKTAAVNIPPEGASFETIVEFDDSSSTGNFEANDTLEAHLLLTTGSGQTEVNLIPASLDTNGDGILNGYTGADYNSHLSSDEFNLAGRPAEMAWTEGVALSCQIPPGTVTAQLIIRAVNDNPSETFRVKGARFTPAQGFFDHDRDGISDDDELSAGTDPFNAASFLKVTHLKNGNSITVSFPTVPDRAYRVLSSDDMVHWVQENQNNIIGDGSVQGYSVNNGGAPRRFICVQVKRGLQSFP